MPLMSMSGKANPKAPARPGRQLMWGDPGVSEKFYVADTQLSVIPGSQQVILADAGILSEIQHHVYGTATITHNTGTNAKDAYGPYSIYNSYQITAGANTPLVSLGPRGIGMLQTMEYPGRSWQADALSADVANPLTNTSDFFNFPATTGTFRSWARIPVALPWAGMPGGAVGYLILQNKRIANVVKPTFNVTGTAPYNLAPGAANGNGLYVITGNDTVTGNLTFETWKTLFTVPNAAYKMPRYGFTRYLQEIVQPYSGSSFTYNFEPGGVLLRAAFHFYDATAAGGMATSNLSQIAFQYGTNKQLDVFTPYRNILEQLDLYGRTLYQGTYVFDYYTRNRTLRDAKSTENLANVQVVATFASSYSVPANSQCYVLLDKVYAVQNYLAR